MPIFSIIICIRRPNKRFFDDLNRYRDLTNKNFEIILVTEKDAVVAKTQIPVRVVKAKKTDISLGEKRDIGIFASKGKYCAFIDDDAYPHKNWLSAALSIFTKDNHVGAVGGPNVTSKEDSYWEKIGGYIYESYVASGGAQYRFLPQKRRFVAELQGVNMIILKRLLVKLGGFNSRLYSGDDSKVCSNIRSLGYTVVYDPHVVVYHHRKAFPWAHLIQIRNMGTHRGFFVKAYPDTLAPIYFFPPVFAVSVVLGLLCSLVSLPIRIVFVAMVSLLYLAGFLSILRKAGLVNALVVSAGIILTHLVYGIFFIRGLFMHSIERKMHENE